MLQATEWPAEMSEHDNHEDNDRRQVVARVRRPLSRTMPASMTAVHSGASTPTTLASSPRPIQRRNQIDGPPTHGQSGAWRAAPIERAGAFSWPPPPQHSSMIDIGESASFEDRSSDAAHASTSDSAQKSLTTSASYEDFFAFLNEAHDLGYRVSSPDTAHAVESTGKRTICFERPSYSRSLVNDTLFEECYRRFYDRRRAAKQLQRFGVPIDRFAA